MVSVRRKTKSWQNADWERAAQKTWEIEDDSLCNKQILKKNVEIEMHTDASFLAEKTKTFLFSMKLHLLIQFLRICT